MSVRRRARERRRQRFSGWIDDGRGAMHIQDDRAPSPQSLEALFELRDAVLRVIALAEREAGRWEDDGGPPGPDRGRVTALLPQSRRAWSRP